MPTLPHEILIADVVYPVVLLSYSRSLSMLPTMVGYLQSRLRVLTKSFYHVEALEDDEGNDIGDKNGERKLKMPNPRVELPYTYLMAWYVMHSPSLMSAVQASEDFVSFVQKLKRSSWQGGYMFTIRKTIQNENYQLVRCFPDFLRASYGERLLDYAGSDELTTLSTGVFCWLVNIRPGT